MSKKAKRLAKAISKSAPNHTHDYTSSDPSAARPTDNSPFVHQRDKIDWSLSIRERGDLTDKQKQYRDLILDKKTKVVFINGPAGTSKTYLAIYCGLLLLNMRRVSHLTFVRTIAESASKSLGSLPGEANDKMSPYLMPLMDKLDELLPSGEVKRLMAEERARGMPVNYLRGASMNAQYIVVEEAQNYDIKELTTVLTRIGQYSKMIIIGDTMQSDINGRSGFLPLFDWFNQPSSQEQGIHCVSFTKDDIVRSGILRHIAEMLERYQETHPTKAH